MQVHHIIERSNGGSDEPDNLIAICITCHIDVHTKCPFTRRFTPAELKAHRNAVYELVAKGALIPPEDDYSPQLISDNAQARTSAQSFLKATETKPLLPEALDLLIAAANHPSGYFVFFKVIGGCILNAGNRQFLSEWTARKEATYREAVNQLLVAGLVRAQTDKVYLVTHEGYLMADDLAALQDTDTQPG